MNWYTYNNLKDLLTAKINETGGVAVVNHQGTYTKVPYYINPTKRDLGQISSNDLVRAFIMPNKNIVAWNPYEATHFEMAENNEELRRSIPVYLWPFGEVMITDFSKSCSSP